MVLVNILRDVRFIGTRVRSWAAKDGDTPARVLIFLHGSGITGFGMEKWLERLVAPPPGMLVMLPSAPMREYRIEGRRSSVWHQRKELNIRGMDEDLVGIDEMCEGLHEMVEKIKGCGVDDVTVGGFSMGGHLALHAVYRRNLQVERAFALSSFLIENSAVFGKEESWVGSPPLYMAHGDEDKVVPLNWARETKDKLEQGGVMVNLNMYKELGHDLNGEILTNVFDWVTRKGML